MRKKARKKDSTPLHDQNSEHSDSSDSSDSSWHAEHSEASEGDDKKVKKVKKHLIHPTWLRRTLKTLLGILIAILLLPVLLYIPFVQDIAVKIACNVVHDSTGMDVGIGKLRLKFPLDVQLNDVYVVEATGDTMVRAREVIADVKLLPLFALDVQLNRLNLNDGYFRMMAADSSMVIKVNAGLLEVDGHSSANIAKSEILLNKTKLRDGKLSLYMNVWKKKPTPEDTTSQATPFLIRANDLDIENFEFAMSMLPTIDTLDVNLKKIQLKRGVVDLRQNLVQWSLAKIADGKFRYLTPTAEYIKTHPAPPSEPSTGPPMRIMGDSIAVENLSALYAVKGAKPLPGFDAQYIDVSEVYIGMKNFYNEASTVRLPLTLLRAHERCGLRVTEGSGTIGIDSIGLTVDNVRIRTPYTAVNATASVPFAVMALDTQAPLSANANGRIGLPDVEYFMPAVKSYTKLIPARKPLDFDVRVAGSLSSVNVDKLHLQMPGVVRIDASGSARNPMDYKKMVARLKFSGDLTNPAVADQFLPPSDSQIKIPAFTIDGTAEANGLAYGADFVLDTDAGGVAAVGKVALTPETYNADVTIHDVDVARFVPSIGIGRVSGHVQAEGRGFNPLAGTAVTDAIVNIHSIEYNHRELRDIRAAVNLSNAGDLVLSAISSNPGLDFDIEGSGSIHPDDYTFDVRARMRDVNLEALGLTDSICSGSGDIMIAGTASPDKWLYDVALDVSSFDWNLPGQYIHLPGGIQANVKTTEFNTALTVNSLLTTVDFNAEAGLKPLIDAFTKVGDIVTKQIDAKSIAIDEISSQLPRFDLRLDASGRGLLSQFLRPQDMSLDTVYAHISNDSIITGNVNALNFTSPSINLDSIGLTLKERGQLLDYALHVGNRRGTLDEFAEVNLRGYLGNNRASAYLTQKNIKGEQGYRFGLTAALEDSVVTAHITPLNSTIAYLPWKFNDDNYVDFNLYNKHINANLAASSKESSVMIKTQPNAKGQEELALNINNLHIEDFLQMWALAPPIKGALNADMHITYIDQRFIGSGTLGVKSLTYDKMKIGDLDLNLDAGYGLNSSTDVNVSMLINGRPALSAYANLQDKGEGLEPDSLGVSLTRFPLDVANPFLGDAVSLRGFLNGDMRMDGSFSKPILNGSIAFDSVAVHVPIMAADLKLEEDLLSVTDNVVKFDKFGILGANANPLTISGTVNAKDFSNIIFDLNAAANNFQVINSDKRSKGDLFGKIFLNLNANVKGPMSRLNLDGDVNLLGTTDATYRLNIESSDPTATSNQDVVKFVNFNDTTQVAQSDSIVESPLNMRINAHLTISPGTHLEALLSTNGTDKLELQPTANLNYFQNYMGDMTLNGVFTLGQGYVRYAIPVVGEKMFTFDPNSTVTWGGNVLNPTLNITATDEMKANVTSGSNSRLVNFLVTLHVASPLEQLKLNFDLSTNDDVAIQNELQSMSADQRQTQAMNLLLYGQYTGQNTKADANLSGNFLYSFLESQLNSWAANHIRGVDLSFGISQYDKVQNGVSNTQTSYSYKVSKSLFNNRFKIQVGGNYSTDSADDEIAQNLISDVAVEYIIKQTQSTDMSVRLFRHTGYESILEGEVTEMGVGFVMKRRLDNLKSLFRFGRRKKKTDDQKDKEAADSVHNESAALPVKENISEEK